MHTEWLLQQWVCPQTLLECTHTIIGKAPLQRITSQTETQKKNTRHKCPENASTIVLKHTNVDRMVKPLPDLHQTESQLVKSTTWQQFFGKKGLLQGALLPLQ